MRSGTGAGVFGNGCYAIQRPHVPELAAPLVAEPAPSLCSETLDKLHFTAHFGDYK